MLQWVGDVITTKRLEGRTHAKKERGKGKDFVQIEGGKKERKAQETRGQRTKEKEGERVS